MKTLNVNMPLVATCNATECAYNKDEKCNAKAITVGDGDNPQCDTFIKGDMAVTHQRHQAGVGACKVSGCEYNEDLECIAEHIHVNREVKCGTYQPMSSVAMG